MTDPISATPKDQQVPENTPRGPNCLARRLFRPIDAAFLLAFGVLLLLNLAGDCRSVGFDPSSRDIVAKEEFHHGWPFLYVRRECNLFGLKSHYIHIWCPAKDVLEFREVSLLLNLAVAWGISCCVAAVWRWRRRHRHRLLQLHLSDVFILVLASACLLSWGRIQYERDLCQQRTLAELGVSTLPPPRNWNDQLSPGFLRAKNSDVYAEPILPTWLDQLSGIVPRWQTVVGLRLGRRNYNGAGLAHLCEFTDLKYLDVCCSGCSDAELKHVGQLRQLRVLHTSAGLGDAGMAHLRNLEQLEELWVYYADVTDQGMVHVRNLRRLRALALESRLSNDGLRHIAGLTRLERLEMPIDMEGADLSCLRRLVNRRELELGWGIPESALVDIEHLHSLRSLIGLPDDLSDRGLASLSNLVNLKDLDLSGTHVTDSGLSHLKNLSNLEEISLRGTAVTDAGLRHLEGLTRLRRLDLSDTGVSDEGVKRFEKLHPYCQLAQ